MSRRKEQTKKRRGYWLELHARRPRPLGPFDTVICHPNDIRKINSIVSEHHSTHNVAGHTIEVRTSPEVPVGKCYFLSRPKVWLPTAVPVVQQTWPWFQWNVSL